jgi:S-adenosylmethionine:tRNA ribosyltransferase-isomerase
MRLSDFDFPFDPALIADRPFLPRDQSRLLVARRDAGSWSHHRVAALPSFLEKDDLLVVNETKVLPVRLTGRKRPGSGKVDLVLVRPIGLDQWEVLLKGNIRPGQVLELGPDAEATVMERGRARTTVRLRSTLPIGELLATRGQMPLPPYVRRPPTEADREWYQTVFAREEGAIAAPTAGLHFTEELLTSLRTRGIRLARLTLHVGPGTFQPVTVDRIEAHVMLPEFFRVPEETCRAIAEAKRGRRRIVAVGTTVVRALETAADPEGRVCPVAGETGLFITPGYRFRVVDALMTNFHLPRTTLLMLVAAFVGRERLLEVYREAIRERYRFYSYGDAMLIL